MRARRWCAARRCAPVAARLPSARPRSVKGWRKRDAEGCGGGRSTGAAAWWRERRCLRQCAAGVVRLEAAKCECAREAGREASWLPSQLTRGCGTRARRCCLSWHCSTTLNADRRGVWLGSVRLEESGEWSGGVPECRTAHAAHQQRVERGGRRPRRSRSFQGRQRIFAEEIDVGCPSSFQDIFSPTVLCG